MKDEDLIEKPKEGVTCPALYKENFEYHLSGDCKKFCLCILNDKACTGRYIHDPKDSSSQFFSRGKCSISKQGLKQCPNYGLSKNTLKSILKEKLEKEIEEKLKHFE